MTDWRINGTAIEVCDESGQWGPLCEAFGISSVKVDLLSGDHWIEFFVESSKGGRSSGTVKRRNIERRSIMKVLYDKGLSFMDTEDDVNAVQEIFLGSETLATREIQHHRLGFAEVDGQRVFLLDRPIGLADPVKGTSRYAVPNIMTPRGKLEDWLGVIKAEVIGHPALEMALAIGAVAPIAHLLREAHKIIDLPILAFIGPSTTGKTSGALRVGASIWGYPVESIGIIDDLNATQNAFFQSLAQNVGVPTFVDETSAKPSWNFDEMIYFLPKGREKKRCDASGQIRSVSFFSGAVIFTGERSLLKLAEENSGLHARILELTLEKWTEDADHAERITEGCCHYYGTAAPTLVRWLLSISKDRLSSIFATERQKLKAQIGHMAGIEGRLMKICAMILTAAWAIENALGLKLDTEEMRHLLCEQMMAKRPEEDRPTRVYRALLEQIAENGSKFLWPSKKTTDHASGKDIWGLFSFREGVLCVWLGRERFKIMLDIAGVHDPTEITKPFCENGWLVDFGNRHYYANQTINGVNERACCILMPDQPNIFSRISELSAKATAYDMVRALRGQSFEATMWSGQAESDRRVQEVMEASGDRCALGLVKPCAQGEAIVLNGALFKALDKSNKLFATIVKDERILLLTQQPVSQASIKMTLKKMNELRLDENRYHYKAICDAIQLTMQNGEGISFTEIVIDNYKGFPAAAVSINWKDSLGAIRGEIDGWKLPINDADNNRDGSHVEQLLSDENGADC